LIVGRENGKERWGVVDVAFLKTWEGIKIHNERGGS
jgi:hypothetical protein